MSEQDPDAAHFWAGCRSGRLVAQRCAACGHLRFPPAPICPECLHGEAAWEALSGEGEVLSYVVFHRGYHADWMERVPYNVALVQLAEGPRMFSNVSTDPDHEVEVGMRVKVDFVERDGGVVPVFGRSA